MATTVYKSTDASAPVLTGQVGSLTALLHAVLVAGYGSKTAAGWTSVATANAGANEVYRQGGGGLKYLNVNDNGPGAGTYKEVRVRGWEVKADTNDVVDGSNTGPFPSIAQAASGLFVRKSATLDATARPWTMLADDRTFSLFVQTGDAASQWYGFHFGDYYSLVSGDTYNQVIIARATENSTVGAIEALDVTDAGSTWLVALAGHYVCRAYTGLGGSVAASKTGASGFGAGTRSVGVIPYPNGADGGLYISPLWVGEGTTGQLHGRLRGLWHQLHPAASFADGDTFSGSGDFTGRTFLLLKQTPNAGIYCAETSNWDTST